MKKSIFGDSRAFYSVESSGLPKRMTDTGNIPHPVSSSRRERMGTTAAHAIRHTPPCCCRPAHGNGSWGIFRTILMPPSNSTPRTRSRSARGFKAMPQTREPPGAEAKLPKNFMATRPSESRKAVGSYTSMMIFHKVPLPRLKD